MKALALFVLLCSFQLNAQTLQVPLPAGCVPALNGYTVGCATGPVTPPNPGPTPPPSGGLPACAAAGYSAQLIKIQYPLNAAGTAGQNYRIDTAISGPRFGNSDALVLYFDTPSHDPTGNANFSVVARGGAPNVNRVAALAITPCVFPLVYSMPLPAAIASQGPTFHVSLTTAPSQWTTVLAPSTRYYITVVNRDGYGGVASCTTSDCAVFIDSN